MLILIISAPDLCIGMYMSKISIYVRLPQLLSGVLWLVFYPEFPHGFVDLKFFYVVCPFREYKCDSDCAVL